MILHYTGAAIAVLITWMTYISHQSSPQLGAFLVTAVMASLLILILRLKVQFDIRQFSTGWMLVYALLFRIIGISGEPLFEDDYFRFLLDGCVFWHYGSPYGLSPQEIFDQVNPVSACRDLSLFVNYPTIETIYPPVLQGIFAIAYWLAPGNITGLQILFALFDLLTILLLLRFCKPENVMLYAWCPLVIKEFAMTAHPDIVGITFLLAGFTSLVNKRFWMASALTAAACASKIFALIFAPFILVRLRWPYWILFAFILSVIYLPFLLRGPSDMATLGLFARSWQFNGSIFTILSRFLADEQVRLLCLALFSLVWFFAFYRYVRYPLKTPHTALPVLGTWLFGLFFLLSPVVNPWYLVWFLPLACFRPMIWPWVWSVTVLASYINGINTGSDTLNEYAIYPWAQWLQYLAVAIAMVYDSYLLKSTAVEEPTIND